MSVKYDLRSFSSAAQEAVGWAQAIGAVVAPNPSGAPVLTSEAFFIGLVRASPESGEAAQLLMLVERTLQDFIDTAYRGRPTSGTVASIVSASTLSESAHAIADVTPNTDRILSQAADIAAQDDERSGRGIEIQDLVGGILQTPASVAYRTLAGLWTDPEVPFERLVASYLKYVQMGSSRPPLSEFLQKRDAQPTPAAPAFLVSVQRGSSNATGVVIGAGGQVITLGYAVEDGLSAEHGGEDILVSFADGREPRRAELRRQDGDLALLDPLEEMDGSVAGTLPTLADSIPAPGAGVRVAWIPAGRPRSRVVDAVVVGADDNRFLFIGGQFQPGMSGAAVLTADGRLLAMVLSARSVEVGSPQIAAVILTNHPLTRPMRVRTSAVGRLGGAGNDDVALIDQLDFEDYVTAFVDLISSPETKPPLTIGIYGSWGMGKSFLLRNIEARLTASLQD